MNRFGWLEVSIRVKVTAVGGLVSALIEMKRRPAAVAAQSVDVSLGALATLATQGFPAEILSEP